PARYALPGQPGSTGTPAESGPPRTFPAPTAQPKHLFHIILEGLEVKQGEDVPEMKLKNFTLRYEGEGIIDSTVAKLIKALNKQGAPPASPAGTCSPPATYGSAPQCLPSSPESPGTAPPSAAPAAPRGCPLAPDSLVRPAPTAPRPATLPTPPSLSG